MNERPLLGRVAVVSGANHGIGAAIAVRLAELGADVAATYLTLRPGPDHEAATPYARQRSRSADATVDAVRALGRAGLSIEADLSDPAAPSRIFATAGAALGPVSILVNNASGWTLDTFGPEDPDVFGRDGSMLTADTVDRCLLVDARGGALMIAELAESVRRHRLGWGRIVGLTSGASTGFPGEVSYGAAKAALENYTMSASIELASDGITANMVHPPVTDTGWVTDAVRTFVAESRDHVHVAEPAEVADVVAWLCTNAARLVTGNVIRLR